MLTITKKRTIVYSFIDRSSACMLYNIIGWGVEKVISLAGSGMLGRDGDEGEEGRYWFPIVMGVPNSQMSLGYRSRLLHVERPL